LLRRHLEIAAFDVGFRPKEREQAGQREDQDQDQNEVESSDGQENQHHESHQPEPRRERGDNAPAVQESDRHEIEQIEEKATIGKAAEHEVAGGEVKALAQKRARRTQQRAANTDDRFNPGVARRFLQQDERPNKRDKHGRAHFQTETFGGQQVSAFVNEHQQNKPHRKPNTPKHGINSDGQDHGAAGLEQQREVFDGGDQGKLEFGEERDNGHAHRSQGFLHLLAEAGPRRRRWRRHEAMRKILILIHGGMVSEINRPREFFPFPLNRNPDLNLNLF
jgi:hypothetical protein